MSPLQTVGKSVGTGETNYAVKLVHFTKPEAMDTPVTCAFEVIDSSTGIADIVIGKVTSNDLYTWFLENNLLTTPRISNMRRTAAG